jgi:EAL domain-containing protein (putative c-di-GMP-specific phosphodiesterase class I)
LTESKRQIIDRYLLTDPNGREIVRAIINLAVSIENRNHRRGGGDTGAAGNLKRIGLSANTGYLSGRPVAPDQFEKLYSKKTLSEPY